MLAGKSWGWAGSTPEFTAADPDEIVAALSAHHVDLLASPASQSQIDAWETSVEMLRDSLQLAERLTTNVCSWFVVLEYELPFEGGRRPDAVVLAGGALLVLEFKGAPSFSLG